MNYKGIYDFPALYAERDILCDVFCATVETWQKEAFGQVNAVHA
jgi:hypothetical protein